MPQQPASSTRPDGVHLQIKQAMERGEFDNLPGQGKPLGDLGSLEDRDWWLKKLIEREQVTGVLPAALQLRKDDLELDAPSTGKTVERHVREIVEGFNKRIIEARRQLQGGPPVVTPTRDVEAEVQRWRERRRERTRRDSPRRSRNQRRDLPGDKLLTPLVPAGGLADQAVRLRRLSSSASRGCVRGAPPPPRLPGRSPRRRAG